VPTSRSRSFDGRMGLVGTYTTYPPFPSITIQTASIGDWGTCDDSTSALRETRIDNALLIQRNSVQYPSFSGVYPPSGPPSKQLVNCPPDYQPGVPAMSSSINGNLSVIEQSSLAWDSLAKTNPNVSHVSLPSYWAELKDLPALWRGWGGDFLSKELPKRLDLVRQAQGKLRSRKALDVLRAADFKDIVSEKLPANAYLTWRWAIKPMISDIQAMWSFLEATQRRLRWLTDLQSGKRVLKRKATLRNRSDSEAPTLAFVKTSGAFITGKRRVSHFEKVWCVVKWRLDDSVGLIPGVGLDFDPLWVKAHQLTFGISYHEALSTLWQIMPWSWFVDWFLHISTVIDATNNTIPMTSSDTCLMRHTRAIALTELDSSSSDLSWCKPTGVNRQSQDRKQRLIVNPILPFAPSFMPVFTTGQWSILGTLAVLRAR